MSGNEREHEISAPNRHSRTGRTQRPEMSGYARKNQKSGPRALQEDDAMTFSQLRREVDSLLRKYATELRVYDLRPLADEYCDQWEESVAQDETPPMPSGLFEKLPGKSFAPPVLPGRL